MPPWLLVVFLGSLLAALGYQILRTRPLARVPLYWAFVFVMVLLAESLADSVNLNSPTLGELQILPDILAAGLALAILFVARL